MNILIISQCNKQALVETRRVVDQFAERKGSRTWQTQITKQGSLTLRKILRKSARKNTAIVCHWMKKDSQSELLWTEGNISMFNSMGTVPTNRTSSNILRSSSENQWHTIEDIALLVGIAGLFHDFGKANELFQKKLKTKKKLYEPYRHEWVSLRLFQAFVGNLSDEQWLKKLGAIPDKIEKEIQGNLIRDHSVEGINPFESLTPLAKCVAWLILSHHRLPVVAQSIRKDIYEPNLGLINDWLSEFEALWNSPQCKLKKWEPSEYERLWNFKDGLPFASKTWKRKAAYFSKRALKRPRFYNTDWWSDIFSMHLARLSLMLSDHAYSAKTDVETKWQDKKNCKTYANTNKKTGKLKQKLDEHLIGVGHYGFLLSRSLPNLSSSLPSIAQHKGFKKISSPPYSWQNKAYQLACSIRSQAKENGFFGVNMASTGCGKTLANGRIIYGLSDEKKGCRFSVAMGLRTLTLQTGSALRERLTLEEDDLAVLIGSQAVKKLHNLKEDQEDNESFSGSESEEEIFPGTDYVRYEGSLDSSFIGRLIGEKNINKIISAPILVSTVDHLVPCTEGIRGGKQIAPMLRLLTSDLVLDEPDDFDTADLPALTRLVHWAGLLGSKVLLSSATLPPSLVQALFEAYISGRKSFNKAYGEANPSLSVACAWFDEYSSTHSSHQNSETFSNSHLDFVCGRAKKLSKTECNKLVEVAPVTDEEKKFNKKSAVELFSRVIHRSIVRLHKNHNFQNSKTGKEISIGLIRMANINPLVSVAKKLMQIKPPDNCRIHYCIYHSHHPLIVRSKMEHKLDKILARHDQDKIWNHMEIQSTLSKYPEQKHIFIVLATPVAEIGRDHDYDWAICEPSSMRSIIQLAGRVLRHRKKSIYSPNIHILSHNYKGLVTEKGKPVFTKPGYETEKSLLESRDIRQLLHLNQVEKIDATPRIIENSDVNPKTNLADLEHYQLRKKLLTGSKREEYAALWWRTENQWNGEIQIRTPFRKNTPETSYVAMIEEPGDEPQFCLLDKRGEHKDRNFDFKREDYNPCEGNNFWLSQDVSCYLEEISDTLGINLTKACLTFGVFQLSSAKEWIYNRHLGFYNDI